MPAVVELDGRQDLLLQAHIAWNDRAVGQTTVTPAPLVLAADRPESPNLSTSGAASGRLPVFHKARMLLGEPAGARASITKQFVVAGEHRRTQIKAAAITRSLSVMQSLHYGALIITSRFVSRCLVTWMPCLKTPAISNSCAAGLSPGTHGVRRIPRSFPA